jgi:hypothetical protein
MPTVETPNNFGGLGAGRRLAQVLFETIGQLAVSLRALFRGHGLYGGAERALIALTAGAHEVYKEICAGHGLAGVCDRAKYIDRPSRTGRRGALNRWCFHFVVAPSADLALTF